MWKKIYLNVTYFSTLTHPAIFNSILFIAISRGGGLCAMNKIELKMIFGMVLLIE
jgi:hypothetical protein